MEKREGTLKKDPRGKESQEREREPLRRAKKKLTSPKLDETTPKELEKGSNLKWGYPEKRNGVDKNPEQWVSDQNKFWERKGEKLEETIPKVFEPQISVKILQRGKHPQSEVAKQTPKEIGVSKDFWNSNYDRPSYRNGYQMKYVDENRNWGEGMVMEIKISREGPMGGQLLNSNILHHPKGKGLL